MWKHRSFSQNWAKSLCVLLCLSFQNAAKLKREALCFYIWFWNFCQNFGNIINELYLQHQKNLLCITVNQKMFDCEKTCVQVNGTNWIFALNLWVQRCYVHEDGIASEVHPLLLHGSDICVTYLRPGWLWDLWISAVFNATFQMAEWRENLPPSKSCIHLGLTTESGENHCSSAAGALGG